MTCQVVLMNAWGVALASDSAVTSGNRVLNGSEKIFALDSPHQIAVLTSSNARLMDYPWESILSGWADTLTGQLDSVEEYWEHLAGWLRTKISKQTELTDPEYSYVRYELDFALGQFLFEEVWLPLLGPLYSETLNEEDFKLANTNTWDDEFRERLTSLVPEDVSRKILDLTKHLITNRVEQNELATNFSYGQASVWYQTFNKEYERRAGHGLVTELIMGYPEIDGLRDLLEEAAVTFLAYPDRSHASWLCMVGFGENDLLPSLLQREVHGLISGNLILGEVGTGIPISTFGHAFYGQRDALDALVFGHDSLVLAATSRVNETLSSVSAEFNDAEDDRITQMRQAYENAFKSVDLQEAVVEAGREQRTKPFQRTIQMSPISDLAEFAGKLVGVQAVSAAFTQENPTVGGAIDVATITRHHGFQWVRKKGKNEN